MCFFKGKNNKAKIATEDIVVYKSGFAVGNPLDPTGFKSSIYRFKYVRDEIYCKSDESIQKAHSEVLLNGEVYHSFKTPLRESFNERVGMFIIPKGASYWENELEYASSQIKFTGIVIDIKTEIPIRYSPTTCATSATFLFLQDATSTI